MKVFAPSYHHPEKFRKHFNFSFGLVSIRRDFLISVGGLHIHRIYLSVYGLKISGVREQTTSPTLSSQIRTKLPIIFDGEVLFFIGLKEIQFFASLVTFYFLPKKIYRKLYSSLEISIHFRRQTGSK